MPKRTDIETILIIGSGPIIIGQSCEFDYSGTQACKSLREEGYKVVLVNSNPATIMTDPEMADCTYIEPVTPEAVEKIIALERPDALLPTLGGQTGLNTAVALAESGVLDRYGVEMIGATLEVIHKAEARDQFKQVIAAVGLKVPDSRAVSTLADAHDALKITGLPSVIRPSFTLGGTGGGIAYNIDEFDQIVSHGLSLSMTNEVLVEASVLGWKEYEMEVMRDRADNVVIVCSIENFDPMGVHTGDSITVAPAQTLTDKEYQKMRDASLAIIREIGVETGGSNIQFAINPRNGDMIVIEMNPRVSRSSALASKATGFPIAKIAAKLAVGMTLDEIPNDITKKTPACFEPAIDYCVVKMPRFAFEKFPGTDTTLTTQMKSVGETMSIGRTFKEALQKSIRSLETGHFGLGYDGKDLWYKGEMPTLDAIRKKLITPGSERLYYLRYAMLAGMDLDEIYDLTSIDKWFLHNLREIVRFESKIAQAGSLDALPEPTLLEAKRLGFSDRQIATACDTTAEAVRTHRLKLGIVPTYKLVDTCAAEFEAFTPYYYSTYETEDETRVSDRKKIMILGGGPNRIGQGIEFDYCCVHASMALRELGYETIMVNSNPETVSTDYDISDHLFFEPLTLEDVLAICDRMQPAGVIVQFGGQTPLNLAEELEAAGVTIIGTSVASIDRAEDREKFKAMLHKLELIQPENGTATTVEQAQEIAEQIGYPVVVRPSYVLGGRAMEIVSDPTNLARYMTQAVDVSSKRPVLIDKFLEDAIEVDVDAICDGHTVVIGGLMEHIEEAGIHSGDSCCVMPAYTLSDALVKRIHECTRAMALELNVQGLMNVQFAVRNDVIYIIEVNPRASRTIPFVSKAIGVPLAKLAAKVMAGMALTDLGFTEEVVIDHYAVKAPVFPFSKMPGSDIILGPEMKSTGEVMGIDANFGVAFAKAQIAARQKIPTEGTVFISVSDRDKREIIFIAKGLQSLGFKVVATHGTAKVLERNGVIVETVRKIHEGRPCILDLMRNGTISLIVNTPSGSDAREDEKKIRSLSVSLDIPCLTTLSAASAFVNGIEAIRKDGYSVKPLQQYHPESRLTPTKKPVPQS